jgi:hypothetical protein
VDSDDIFLLGVMTSENLECDLNAGSFAKMVGALPSVAADEEAHNAAADTVFRANASELEPGTPIDDLFGNTSPTSNRRSKGSCCARAA